MRKYRISMSRMYFIDQKLRNRTYPNCTTLAKEYQVSVKTIQRDIECMRNMGAPIEFDRRQNGYYYTDPTYYLPAIPLTEREALLFVINERILSQYQQAPYYADLKKAIEKILQFFPDELDIEHKGDFISFHSQPQTPMQKQKFDLLQQAIYEERQINIKYYAQHRNEVTDRTVDPYQARWIRERQWHHSQKLTQLEDGGLILEMDVQGLDEVKRWVMQYGGEVEVVEPEFLKCDVINEIDKMNKMYKA